MKLRVVGWTFYDDDLESGKVGWAAQNAIIDDVKKHGYDFSGWSHQECLNCAPVLNDGKIYRFSQRGWGGVMAEAHGHTGRLDYTWYTFVVDPEQLDYEIRPTEQFDEDNFTPESDLNERFELEVSQEVLAEADTGSIKLDDLIELRYIDVGDTLALRCGDKMAEYTVVDVERKKDLTDDEMLDFEMAFHDFHNEQRRKHANEVFNSIKVVMIVTLSHIEKPGK